MTPCKPDTLPITTLDWRNLLPAAGAASRALARYDGALQTLPNPALLLSPLMSNEAVLSSRIEGTQATLEEVFDHEAGEPVSDAKRDDIEEVLNYRACVGFASESLVERGLTLGFIREIHQGLMQSVRGRDKRPGEFRADQNWIGRAGASIDEARFVPPDPIRMQDALRNWESYANGDQDDPLLQTGIAHAQFEIIHPFNDGNGRIGRMLIPLLLTRRRAISSPMFYISEHFESRREQYYDALLGITQAGDWTGWLEFFLQGVQTQAENNLARATRLHAHYVEQRQHFVDATRSQFASTALDAFFRKPIISAADFYRTSGISSRATSNHILNQLEQAGLVTCLHRGAGRRPSRFAMLSVLRIAEGRG